MEHFRLGDSVYCYFLLWTVILFFPFIIFLVWFKTNRFTRVLAKFPGFPSHPILGILHHLLKGYTQNGNAGMMDVAYVMVAKYGQNKIVSGWAFWQPFLAIFKPHETEILMTSQDALDKPFPYKFLQSWLGTGLLTSSGNKWKTRRRLLTPAFHFRILEDFVHVFNDESMVLVEKLKQYANNPAFDIVPFIKSCTLDIICETAMGVHIGAQKNKCPTYVKVLQEVGESWLTRLVHPWAWNMRLYSLFPSGRRYKYNLNILHTFTIQVIQTRKQQMITLKKERLRHEERNVYLGKKRRECFLDLLLHYHLDDGLLSEEDIREEVDTFMFEGHDTTSVGISWALYNIGLYPEVQKKVHEELDSIFGEDTIRSVTSDDLKEMKYLERVLKESLRMYPSVPFIARQLSKDVEIPSEGVTLPKGLNILEPIFFIHRDKEIFPDPERFDPDRFLPENSHNRHPFAYIPFSAGPRNCIGQRFAMMEEKIIVANILRHLTIHSVDPPESLNLVPELVLHCLNGIRVELKEKVNLTF